ncbi:hypothetical protein MCEMSE15_00199 [Fimbriimonadaceae bacterium]|jgi:hypothetical protein
MFRRLYWVSEIVESNGQSKVIGVYTSIPDLIEVGLGHREPTQQLRLGLYKLDSDKGPFGIWTSPNFEGMEATLQSFVSTDEISSEHVAMLVSAVALVAVA